MSDLRLIRGASNSRYGGIHWYEWNPKEEAVVGPRAADLFLLHPLPLDGTVFNVIAPYLAAGRTVVAPEYPGYGRSDTLREDPTIGKYAGAMIDVVRARDTHGPADLFGFGAGCLVAVELALRFPDEIHRLVLVDVPYHAAAERRQKLREAGTEAGFVAAFSYPVQERLPIVGQPCLVVATGAGTAESSGAAAKALPDGRLKAYPEVGEPVLETGAAVISAATLEFLDS